uniref:LIM domain-containing protein 1 n=1 Tax=Poecilia mexicana TaxID=48701 RepID=A0A3B3Y0R0_9TELE
MDKYEDLGLEASKFIEDLNMYEASRDGLFRMRRDAGNNPDFEETRRVFASKMTKIHMQKQQEEMAKSNQVIKMNGGHHGGAHYTKDRPPINSYRQPGEAAAKPPILSGPVPSAAPVNQCVQAEAPASRAYGYGSNYDNERLEPHSSHHSNSSMPSCGSPVTSALHPVSPSREGKLPPTLSGSSSTSHHQPQRDADYHVQQPVSHYLQSVNHNGPAATSFVPEMPQPKAQVTSAAPSASKNQLTARSQMPGGVQAMQIPSTAQPVQPLEQGPSAAEIKLEALTKQLEKEMDVQRNVSRTVISFATFCHFADTTCNALGLHTMEKQKPYFTPHTSACLFGCL